MTNPASSKEERLAATRAAAEADLMTFIRLVAPHRVLGACHEEICEWWIRPTAKTHQLMLIPRDHQKSALVAYRVAWYITKYPDVTILYLSATSTLAEKQLKFIQDILTSKIYRRYWPEMVNEQEAKREKWTSTEFSVDHPKRKEEGVRDATVFAAGLTTNITGLHCRVAVLDDVVVKENAYSEEGREKVAFAYSLLASVETTNAEEWAVGTRYHPNDLYSTLSDLEEETYDADGNFVSMEPIYEVWEGVLEDSPGRDGTGEYLWPRQRRKDGKLFGFDIAIRAKKKAKYIDQGQFFAQYYNDPSDPENARLNMDLVQYYDPAMVKLYAGQWYVGDKRLNLASACDLAFTEGKRSDYTAIVVLGMNEDGIIYVLDIMRFRTSEIPVMAEAIRRMHQRWYFRSLRVEVGAAQGAVVKEIKRILASQGITLFLEEVTRGRGEGDKQERIDLTLLPRYQQGMVWHYRGGNCQVLEEELRQAHPAHDDVSDAMATAAEKLVPPSRILMKHDLKRENKLASNSRFGGIS